MSRNIELITEGDCETALARLYASDLSEVEVEVIRNRAACDKNFRDGYLDSLEFLADIEALADDADILSIANGKCTSLKGRVAGNWPSLSMVAGLLLAITAGVTIYLGQGVNSSVDVQRYVTRVGEQKTVTLPDGSVITLNTATQLIVSLSDQKRQVTLDRGEVYFDVAKDPVRPFVVDLGARSVTVLGTEFNIQKFPGQYKLAVVEGEVSLHEPEQQVSLSAPLISVAGESTVLTAPKQHRVKAGWVAEFDIAKNAIIGYRPKSMDKYRGWRTGLIRFYKEPFYKVVQELNRYSAKKILIEDKSVMDLSVYAAVNVKELGSALNALEQLLPIKVTSHFDRIVIVGSE